MGHSELNKNILKKHPLLKIINSSLIDLPTPTNISYLWNFGSLLGICLIIQIISGLVLTFRFCPDRTLAFNRVVIICQDIFKGWIFRIIHSNGASIFFICLFIHIGRGIYYYSFKLHETWTVGVIIFLLTIITAFLGYVLPWGQISFWGASVITNLISAIPFIGNNLVLWVWGGFSVDNPTLTRFFRLHYLIPFVILILILIHLLFLHQTGSNSPLGFRRNSNKISIYPFFIFKDIFGILILIILLILLVLFNPYLLRDPDNFIIANPIVTPIHIQPEWYFLFAYAILRAIPNKLGGVVALVISIVILLFLLIINNFTKFKRNQFYYFNKIIFWNFSFIVFLLTWIGIRSVEIPYIFIGQVLTIIYFSYFFINPILNYYWNKILL